MLGVYLGKNRIISKLISRDNTNKSMKFLKYGEGELSSHWKEEITLFQCCGLLIIFMDQLDLLIKSMKSPQSTEFEKTHTISNDYLTAPVNFKKFSETRFFTKRTWRMLLILTHGKLLIQ